MPSSFVPRPHTAAAIRLRRLVAALGALGALVAAGAGCSRPEPLPVVGQVPAFSLLDAAGGPVSKGDLAGKVWIADFIFTRCEMTCPMQSARMQELAHDLGGVEDLRLVSISVDPEHDTPQVLRAYGERFGADPARWLFLTGPVAAVDALVHDGFALAVARRADGAPGTSVTHSSRFVLVDREGRIRGYYDSTSDESLDELRRDAARLS